ncbi:hypothetical protein PYW08_007642 [Mythimna loreyi]|uniref:Uncharacterized protein n=1 Tax=Mythimna loreyi TaxID=667449 RepID=A0ACC2QCB3_9NEOP|nr:hypothetical protein PYW08_007642 [Mythimna loreyi]
MKRYSILIVLFFCILVDSRFNKNRRNRNRYNLRSEDKLNSQISPPHCTTVTKDTNYPAITRLDYAVAYMDPGQNEAYQRLYCVDPPTVNKAVTTVCDWSAPPQVHFLLDDEYVHIIRQDPTGRFWGSAVISTYQTPVTGGITVYEYGIHIEGEESTFAMNGVIPALTQVYTVNATPTRPEFESKFSFLKIEYNSPMSPVEIEFNPKTNVIAFYIRFPFMDIPFGIVDLSESESDSEEEEESLFLRYFEYGEHVKGEKLSFKKKDKTELNENYKYLDLTPDGDDLKDTFSYILIEYMAPYSDTEIVYKNGTGELIIWVKDPVAMFTPGLILFIFSGEISTFKKEESIFIRVFEWGEHVDGEEKSYHLRSQVDLFSPMYRVNLRVPKAKKKMYMKGFTYIFVEYISPFSDVTVTYNNISHSILFYISYPIMDIPLEITAYSLKRNATEKTL